jgi:hypothetical protein
VVLERGVRLKIIFQPQLDYGRTVSVTGSAITPTNKIRSVYLLEHSLGSFKPNGE